MKKVAVVLIFGLFMVFAFSLAEAAEREKTIEVTVKRGDTLWDYAKKYLCNPKLWPRIAVYNPQIKNPHLIFPGQKVIIPLDVAEEIMKEMKAELRHLRGRVAELEAEVEKLKRMQDDLEEKIEDELAKAKIEELNKNIEDLKAEIASLGGEIKVLEEEIDGLNANILGLEKELGEGKMAFYFLFLLVALGIITGM